MTEGSNRENGESEQPQHDTNASSTTASEPIQLDLFERQRHRWRDTRNAGSKHDHGSARRSVHFRPLGR
jgi:hypothetical protein